MTSTPTLCIRVPAQLKAHLQVTAKANGVSLNHQVVRTLTRFKDGAPPTFRVVYRNGLYVLHLGERLKSMTLSPQKPKP